MTPEERKTKREERKAFLKAEREKTEAALVLIRKEEAAHRLAYKEAAERQRLASLEPQVLRILNRGILDVPVWEEHWRGRNWAAIVTPEPTAAGGVRRSWFERGSGVLKYILHEQLLVGHVVEFGADYITGVGKRKPERLYVTVLAIGDTELVVKLHANLTDALTHKLVRVA